MNDPVHRVVTMTEVELRQVVRQTVSDTLTSLGIEHGEPHEMQKDFLHLREQRISSEAMKNKAQLTLLGIFVAGVLAMVAVGLKEYFKS